MIKPFIGYPGGKRRQADRICEIIESLAEETDAKRYVEPFLGAGTVALRLLDRGWKRGVLLSDANPQLVSLWKSIQAGELDVDLADRSISIAEWRGGFRGTALESPEGYFAFLRHAYGWIDRRNKKGDLNMPHGRPNGASRIDRENLEEVRRLLNAASARILCADFEHIPVKAHARNVFYLDPPYAKKGGHVRYGPCDWAVESAKTFWARFVPSVTKRSAVVASYRATKGLLSWIERTFGDRASIEFVSARRAIGTRFGAANSELEVLVTIKPELREENEV